MKRSCRVMAVIGVMWVVSQSAYADSIEDCEAACRKEYSGCVEQANKFVNDIEVKDAKEDCDKKVSECNAACMDKELNRGFETSAPGQTEANVNPKAD